MQRTLGKVRSHVIAVLVAVVLVCSVAVGELQRFPFFKVGGTDDAAVLLNADQCKTVSFNGTKYLEIEGGHDPYSRVSWEFEIRVSKLDQKCGLSIGYYDKGAGLIEASMTRGGRNVPITRCCSYTRLDTRQSRRMLVGFRFPEDTVWDSSQVHLSITGLQYLHSLSLPPRVFEDAWPRARAAVPRDVAPMVPLSRPMDVVTTAGVASKGVHPNLEAELDSLHELAPLAKVLGFNAIELYVRWNLIEAEAEGVFDFTYYDALVAKIREYGLQWYPLLIVGSAYALPEWFVESGESVGFECLEHGKANLIQSIWSPHHRRHVTRVLRAFGEHYDGDGSLLGVRLGPSGNYGESQYPAGGNWPTPGKAMHIHIGLWAGDPYARADFRSDMAAQYGTIAQLNDAWGMDLAGFDDIPVELPLTMVSKRQRIDFMSWYTREMSEWCGWWAREAKAALPNTRIYQSAGGWGFVEAGTSYTEQTEAMAGLGGGIRLTNETDSYDQNFYATRLATTAARLYGAELGFEPASSHTARGVAARIFNTATTNGDHFFTYHNNIFHHQMAIDQWLEYLPILDTRQDPVIDVAVYYPETMNQLEDAPFRHLYAWGFNPRAREIRRVVEVDYLDEKLIRDGFLDRYKALVFVWGGVIEADVQGAIDAWMRQGGTIFYPSFPKGNQGTVEGDTTAFQRWSRGDTGAGAFHRFPGDMEPPYRFARYVKEKLRAMDGLHPWTQAVLNAEASEDVFFSVQQDGHVLVLNYADGPSKVRLPGMETAAVPAYGIRRYALPVAGE